MGATKAGEWVQCGREFSAEEISQIRETVAWLPGLARSELAATVCEHMDWRTASGTPKRQACQRLLARLEAAGLVDWPAMCWGSWPGAWRRIGAANGDSLRC